MARNENNKTGAFLEPPSKTLETISIMGCTTVTNGKRPVEKDGRTVDPYRSGPFFGDYDPRPYGKVKSTKNMKAR